MPNGLKWFVATNAQIHLAVVFINTSLEWFVYKKRTRLYWPRMICLQQNAQINLTFDFSGTNALKCPTQALDNLELLVYNKHKSTSMLLSAAQIGWITNDL